MKHRYHESVLFFLLIVAALFFVGCASRMKKPMRFCPGKNFASEAVSALNSRSENSASLKANGKCLLKYYADGKKHKENFPVKLWLNPPYEIYLQGDVAFDAKGIVLGSNEKELWMSMKPKEISSYWWGQWQQVNCPENLMINPKTVIEALGIARISEQENWSLQNKDGFDILTKRNEKDVVVKKVYINCCDYLIRKIEYFNANGDIVVVTELDKYKHVLDGFFVPAIIKMIRYRNDEVEDDSVSITISLSSIKSANFTEKVRKRLFTRPQPKGFKHIYKIVNGEIIEE